MEVQQQESNGIVEVSKREFGAAWERVRAQALTPQNEGHRQQLLHRYRMGFAVAGGCFGGLMAGHAATLALTSVMCFIALAMVALFFGAIGKIQDPGA